MDSIVNSIHVFVGSILDLVISPVRDLSPLWVLSFLSVLLGIVLLFVYGWISPQGLIARVKRNIHAALLEAILFRQDLRTSLKAQTRMFLNGLAYFFVAIPPILLLAIPSVFLLSQLNLYFGPRGVLPKEPVLLTLKVEDRSQLYRMQFESDPQLQASLPVRIPETQEVVWRLHTEGAGNSEFSITLGDTGKKYQGVLVADSALHRIASDTYASWWWRLLYPDTSIGEVGDLISHVSIQYPERSYSFLGFQCSWIIVFLIVSVGSGIVASRVFGIEI